MDAPTAPREALVVRLGGERFAVPVESVAEVSRPVPLTRVPGAPTWLAGVANARGRVLPVADLRGLLGLPSPVDGRRARFVLLHVGGVGLGLRTEGVDGVVVLPERLEPVLATLPPSVAALLAGQGTSEHGPLPVLQVDAVLALRSTLPRSGRAA